MRRILASLVIVVACCSPALAARSDQPNIIYLLAGDLDSLAAFQGRWPEPGKFAGSRTCCPQDQTRAVRAAMITRLDRDTGRILDPLDELKLSENTLVIDIGEKQSVSAAHPDIVTRMERLMEDSRVESADFPLRRKEKGKAKP
jgi:hypothetical protein